MVNMFVGVCGFAWAIPFCIRWKDPHQITTDIAHGIRMKLAVLPAAPWKADVPVTGICSSAISFLIFSFGVFPEQYFEESVAIGIMSPYPLIPWITTHDKQGERDSQILADLIHAGCSGC